MGDKATVGADFTCCKYSNLWVDEVNREAQQIVEITPPDDAWRDYKGLDLWMQGKLGPWDVLANYTLAFANGTAGSYFDGYGANPRLKYC